jgi:hypothetical protein
MNPGGSLVCSQEATTDLPYPVHTHTFCKDPFNVGLALGSLHHLEVGNVADVLDVCAPICLQGQNECSQCEL